jgi:hypothetical protein
MALKDLILNKEQVSEELIENILKGRVDLVEEGSKIVLRREADNFSNRNKILLFLAGGMAWEIIEGKEWRCSPKNMEESIGIPGNSLRPILMTLAGGYLVNATGGKYKIMPRGISTLQGIIDGTTEQSKKVAKSTKKKTGSNETKSNSLNTLVSGVFFSTPKDAKEIVAELRRLGTTIKMTSLPSYLLPLVKKEILSREYVTKGKKKVWSYVKK